MADETNTGDLLVAWRDASRAAALAERLAAAAEEAAARADEDALDAEQVASLAEEAARSAEVAARKARGTAERLRAAAGRTGQSHRDAADERSRSSAAEVQAMDRYHEAEAAARERHGTTPDR